MGIRDHACFRRHGRLILQNPLTAVPVDDGFVGWLVQVRFNRPRWTQFLTVHVEAWTTYVKKTRKGWMRELKNLPWSKTDITIVAHPPDEKRLEPRAFMSGSRRDYWYWTIRKLPDRHGYSGVEWSRSFDRTSYYIDGPSFDVEDMKALVHGVYDDPSGGNALFDRLADTKEFEPLFTGPQWLPKTREEMEAAAKAADEEKHKKEAEPIDFGPDEADPDTTEEDRQR